MQELLTVVSIAYKEGPAILRWVAALDGFATHIIVFDNSPVFEADLHRLRLEHSTSITIVAADDIPYDSALGDLCRLRNAGLQIACTEWVMCLDSDEYLGNDAKAHLRRVLTTTNADCIFQPWRTYDAKGALRVDDYKAVLARREVRWRFDGFIHENMTRSLRMGGACAVYTDAEISHLPRPTLQRHKSMRYLSKLAHAWKTAPDARVGWFYSYTLACIGRTSMARRVAAETVGRDPVGYPFEYACAYLLLSSLNSGEIADQYRRSALQVVREHTHDIEYEAFARLTVVDKLLRGESRVLSLSSLRRCLYCL